MKKVIFMLSIMLATVNFISCSNEGTNEIVDQTRQTDKEVWQALCDSIKALNEYYGIQYTRQRPVTSAQKDFIFLADAFGAFYGKIQNKSESECETISTVWSIRAMEIVDSINRQPLLASRRLKKTIASVDSIFNPNPLTNIVFSVGNNLDSLGYYHNKVLYDVISNNLDIFDDANYFSDSTIVKICEYHALAKNQPVSEFINNFYGNSEIMDTVRYYQNIIRHDYSYSQFGATISNNIRAAHDIVTVLYNYVDALTGNNSFEKYSYTLKLLNNINKAKLQSPSPDYDALQAGIIVAYASYKLWK